MGPVLELSRIQKSYQSLRPLRLQQLTIAAGERVAIAGLDAGAAEVLVNLVTGASLPDHGEVRVLGRPTSEIVDGDEWLSSLDRFGIVSPRGVLLDSATIAQNIALVFTLDIEPVPADVRARVAAIASACGIDVLDVPTADVGPAVRARVHLARAIALEPALLVLEHPTLGLEEAERPVLARDVAAVADARRQAALIVTQDEAFAGASAHRALRLEPATGALRSLR
jgi:ABC-type transporter Mla maintaining outer membrane lipid asymmetry ATPase subunit MlaF